MAGGKYHHETNIDLLLYKSMKGEMEK